MTGPEYVAVLRNLQCGHVAAIVTKDLFTVLCQRLIAIDQPGWTVRVEPNTNEIYEALIGGPCPTCQLT